MMNVALSPDLEDLVNEKVASGIYHCPGDVIEEALSLLRQRDLNGQKRLEELRQEIALGVDEANRGELAPLDAQAIKAEGRRRLAAKG